MKQNLDLQVRKILGAAKLYCTPCRKAILKVLKSTARPLRQNEIAKRLGGKHFDKVTIYRTLESFVAAHIVHKAFLQERTWHFELADKCTQSQCHPHFTCTGCGDTHCLPQVSMPMAKNPGKGFIIHHQQVRLEGLCPKCSTAV
jgi:Fur family ferric uptake transcriptional regulator